jgi:hypothetical protein
MRIGGPRSGGGGLYNPYGGGSYPHIIGDLMIPSAYRPPGSMGPGGNLVGPGSSIFHPHGGGYP